MKLLVKKVNPDAKLPVYGNDGDAGFDLYSPIECTIKPGERKLVGTGLSMMIPKGHTGLIWDRSGLASKHGIHVMAGVVDTGYRGEVGVLLKNLGDEDFKVTKHMKIAQMIIQAFAAMEIKEAEELKGDTERGEGGWGSTGTH